MNRFAKIALAALALSTFALPALADSGAGRGARAEHAAHAGQRGEKGDKPQFPMPAADFVARMAKRTEKAQARLEQHIAKKSLPADKAAEARAKFAASQAVINQEVAKVTADGTVTAEEAKQVHQVIRAQSPHQGHKGKKGDKKPA
jgi:hypothetical protein